mmetsp:Transcript_24313/g.50704  ORF Transcript_24313/g.50704 Transcript_24313/m.50704 type:complete len:372 (+) Transcript_24313:1077-2192(+)
MVWGLFSSMTSSSTLFNLSSNSPLYFVPATRLPKSRLSSLAPRSGFGHKASSFMMRAMPSAIAVLPTPGSPSSKGLFFLRRVRVRSAEFISFFLPMTGSMFPASASSVRSVHNSFSVGVFPVPPDDDPPTTSSLGSRKSLKTPVSTEDSITASKDITSADESSSLMSSSTVQPPCGELVSPLSVEVTSTPSSKCSGWTGSDVRSTFAERDNISFAELEKGKSTSRDLLSSLNALVQPPLFFPSPSCFPSIILLATFIIPPLGCSPCSLMIFLSSISPLSSTSILSSMQVSEIPINRQVGVTWGSDRVEAADWEVESTEIEGDVKRSNNIVWGKVPFSSLYKVSIPMLLALPFPSPLLVVLVSVLRRDGRGT